MSDRKYRQHGYMDRTDSKAGSKGQSRDDASALLRSKDSPGGPRAIQMAGTRSLSRCAECGAILPGMAEPTGSCPKCAAALHSCKQCTYFDPAERFECRERPPERIPRKDAANNCNLYQMKVTVEKETSNAAPTANDARRGFENLFKK